MSWFLLAIAIAATKFLSNHSRQHADIRNIAVLFCIIEPVSHHELVSDRKSDVIRLNRQFAARWLVQQGCHAKAFGLMPEQQALKKRECQASVENVLDQNDVLTAQGLIDILCDPYLSTGIPRQPSLWTRRDATIACDSDELKRCLQFHGTNQVA